MASEVKIGMNIGTSHEVDLTNCDISVAYRMSNPVIIVPTPKKTGATANVYTINLAMIQQYIDLTFVLTDGPGTFDFTTPGSTNFEKLGHMAGAPTSDGRKKLTINGTPTLCDVTSFTTTWAAGNKDLAMGCKMSLVIGVINP